MAHFLVVEHFKPRKPKNDIVAIVRQITYDIVQTHESLQLSWQVIQLTKLLESVALQDDRVQPRTHLCEVFSNSGDPVIGEHESLQSQELRQLIKFGDVVIGQVHTGKLVISGRQVFEVWHSVTPQVQVELVERIEVLG